MSAVPSVAVSAVPLPVARWIAMCGLLVGEVVFLTLRFDTETLNGNDGWWAQLLGQAHFLPQLALNMVVALAAFGGRQMWAGLTTAAEAPHAPRVWRRALAGQCVAFGGFALLTRRLLEDSPTESNGAWFFVWGFTGFLVVGLWCLTVLPVAVWLKLLRRSWTVLSVMAVVAIVSLAFASGRLSERLWAPMAEATVGAVRATLDLGFHGVECRQADFQNWWLGPPEFEVLVAPSCSGYEGFGMVAAFLGLYLWLRRDELHFPAALLILPLGLVAVWVANVARIVALIAIGAWGWPDVARGGFHSQAGWLTFNAVVLGMVALSRRSAWMSQGRTNRDGPAVNPAAPYLWPLLVVVGTAMVTAALSPGGFDALYPVRVVVAAAVIGVFRRTYATLGWTLSWQAVGAGVGVFVLWMGLEALRPALAEGSPMPEALAGMPPAGRVLWLIGRILGAVLIVPLAEELAFRGFLLRRLQSSEFDAVPADRWSWFAVLASSAVFGLLHPGRFVAGLLAGVIFAWVYARRGRLADAVVAHAVTNALIAVHVLATGDWELW
jgi:exosortase E/protease (VPEID-CTERM system)